MWERACSRRRRHSQHGCRLTHRFREQARSHRDRCFLILNGLALVRRLLIPLRRVTTMTNTRSDWEQRFQSLTREGRAFIDGQYRAALSGDTFECISPVEGVTAQCCAVLTVDE